MKRIALLLPFFVLSFYGCKPKEVVLHSDVRTEYIRTFTSIVLPVETASAQAKLDCTKEGMVLISRLHIETSRNSRLTLLIDSMNNLSVDAVVERDTIWLQSDSVVVTKESLRTEIEYRDKEISGWQNFRIWMGNISIVFLLLMIGYIIFKFKFKI